MSAKKRTRTEAILAREKRFNEQGLRMAKAAEKNPYLNPAGKAKFDYLQDPLTGKPFRVIAQPDAGHAARLRGAADRKARGTQSSTTRKPIK